MGESQKVEDLFSRPFLDHQLEEGISCRAVYTRNFASLGGRDLAGVSAGMHGRN
jgi:hypothetical protein